MPPSATTHIILLAAHLRLIDKPPHQKFVPKEPIIRLPPHPPLRPPPLLLPLQTIRQIPPITKPQPPRPQTLFHEGDELLFDRVVEDRGGRGGGGEGEEAEVGGEVDGVGEETAGGGAGGDEDDEVGCGRGGA